MSDINTANVVLYLHDPKEVIELNGVVDAVMKDGLFSFHLDTEIHTIPIRRIVHMISRDSDE